MSNKKKIIVVAVIVLISALALVISALKKDGTSMPPQKPAETSTQQNTKESENTEPSKDIKAKFMYYVSEVDENKEEALKVVDELKNEYSENVEFIVINIDKEPEKVYGFALPDETPKLVLLGVNSEFAMKSNCADKDVLKQEIEKVLNPNE